MKLFIRTAFILIFLPLISLILLFIYSLQDQPLAPETADFFTSTPINLDKNFFIASSGIRAPSGETDFHAFGIKLFNGETKLTRSKRLEFENDVVPEKTNCIKQTGHYTFRPPLKHKPAECLSSDETELLLNRNQEILNRLEDLYIKTPDLNVNKGGRGHIRYASIIDVYNLHPMLCVKWKNQVQNSNGQKAIESWMNSTRAFKHIFQGQLNFNDYLQWELTYLLNLFCLPTLFEADTSLIKIHGEEIIDLLDFDHLALWNLEKTLQTKGYFLNADEQTLKTQLKFFYAPNKVRNQLYKSSQDIIQLSKVAPHELDKAVGQLKLKYPDCSLAKLHNCSIPEYFDERIYDFEHYAEAFFSSHRLNARQIATILWIKAHMQNLPAEKMNDFLSAVPTKYHDPINQKPFLWDSEKHSIYHVIQNYDGTHRQQDLIFYNPKP